MKAWGDSCGIDTSSVGEVEGAHSVTSMMNQSPLSMDHSVFLQPATSPDALRSVHDQLKVPIFKRHPFGVRPSSAARPVGHADLAELFEGVDTDGQ